MNFDYDVIIVGAGPAGASCAKLLTEAGKKVLIIDKRKFPRKKCCSGLLSDRAQDFISDNYGCIPEPGNIVVPEKFLDLVFVDCSTRKSRTLEKNWLHIERKYFDQFLISKSGAEFLERAVYKEHIENDESVLVKIETGESEKELQCSYLVDASGGYSRVRRNKQKLYNYTKHAAAIQLIIGNKPGSNFDPGKHYYFLDDFSDMYSWTFMQNRDIRIGITYFSFNRQKKRDYLNNFTDYLLKNNYIVGPEIIQKNIETSAVYCQQSQKRYLYNRGRTFFIGEAAGLMTTITEGISQAFVSAKCLADAMAKHNSLEDIKNAYITEVKKEEEYIKSLQYF